MIPEALTGVIFVSELSVWVVPYSRLGCHAHSDPANHSNNPDQIARRILPAQRPGRLEA